MNTRTTCDLTLVLLTISADADSGIVPYYNSTVKTTTSLGISSSGVATVSPSFTGIQGTNSGATITTCLEKETLSLFQTRVDVGNANDEWIDVARGYTYATARSIQLENTGAYRVTVTYEASGSGGATDAITYETERTYQ